MKRELTNDEWKREALKRGFKPCSLSSLKRQVGTKRFNKLLNIFLGKWRAGDVV